MKYLLILLAMTSFCAFANHSDKELRIRYQIMEDKIDLSVTAGKCLVTGNVSTQKIAVGNGIVATFDNKYITNTDSLGNFSLLVDATDSVIYFFKPRFAEIVTLKIGIASQRHLTVNFFPYKDVRMDVSLKPVIYLYSDEKKEVTIDVNVHGKVSFSYPKIDEGWKVETSKSGTLTTSNGKTYPYLFWEGEHTDLAYTIKNRAISNGYQIKTDTAISFLETKLKQFGFNATERTDFITFWGPRLIGKDYALIQFLFNDGYEKEIASLDVKPTPTSTRRIYMKFSGMDQYKHIIKTVPADVPSFKRTSFTLIEWGGANISLPENIF
jgi:hypothetical protein